jgi:hypothetical protein
MKLTTRQLVTMAIFGSLWGLVEISLGSVLKALNIPVIATLLKLFSIGNIIIGPMIGILMEAVLAEVILSLFGKSNLVACLLAGATGALWSLAQPFFTGVVLFGRDLLTIWLDLLDLGRRLFGLDPSLAWVIVLVLAGVHAAIGMTGGGLAKWVGSLLLKRMPQYGYK